MFVLWGTVKVKSSQLGRILTYNVRECNSYILTKVSHFFYETKIIRKDKAKVIYAPQEVYLPYGQPAILDCHFRSNPPLTNLRWEKDGFLFDPYNVQVYRLPMASFWISHTDLSQFQGVFYKRNGSLYFSTVDETHNGRYSCTPYNDLGTDGPSPLIQVIVQRPPQFTLKPKPIYMTKLGEAVSMTCDATDRDGSHRALIQWTRKLNLNLLNENLFHWVLLFYFRQRWNSTTFRTGHLRR